MIRWKVIGRAFISRFNKYFYKSDGFCNMMRGKISQEQHAVAGVQMLIERIYFRNATDGI